MGGWVGGWEKRHTYGFAGGGASSSCNGSQPIFGVVGSVRVGGTVGHGVGVVVLFWGGGGGGGA